MRLLFCLFLIPLLSHAAAPSEITVYSARDSKSVAPIFEAFTTSTGIRVNLVNGTNEELLARLSREGKSTGADLLLADDLVFLGQASRDGIFVPFESKEVEKNIPAGMIAPANRWYAVSYRARILMYTSDKVKPEELSTYQSLGDEKWAHRLCVSSSSNSFNQALVASFVKNLGTPATSDLLKKWVANFAAPPMPDDNSVLLAIAHGECDIGIIDTHHLVAALQDNPVFPVKTFFPNQESSGTHISGSGIGLIRFSRHIKEAMKLMEYLSSPKVQGDYAAPENEYPANTFAETTGVLREFGVFKIDESNLGEISSYTEEAKGLMKAAGYY